MIKKYVEESLKYLLRTRLFIHKYMDEINAMYDMTPEELRERNEGRFLEIFRKVYFRSDIIEDYVWQRELNQPTKYNIWKI